MFLMLLACANPDGLSALSPDSTVPGTVVHSTAEVDPKLIAQVTSQGPTRALVVMAPHGLYALRTEPTFGPRSVAFKNVPVAILELNSLEEIDALAKLPGVLRIESDQILKAHDTESEAMIGAPIAAQRGYTGQGTAIAILDTGLDYTHADFGSCSAPGDPGCSVLASLDFADEDNALDGDSGHGTNVAAIAAQVAPGAGLIGLDVFDGNGAFTSDILSALDWVVDNQATYNIVAANMSLGGGESQSTCQTSAFAAAIDAAKAAGVLVSVSSGNDGWSNATGFPACVPSATTVGAVYDADLGSASWSVCSDATTGADQITCFSNDADHVDLLAPGSVITAGGISMSGTSQAAPHVAGAAAVVASAYPDLNPTEIEAKLIATGTELRDMRSGRTHPRIDLDAATLAATEGPDDHQDSGFNDGDTGDTGFEDPGYNDQDLFTNGSVKTQVSPEMVTLRWGRYVAHDGLESYLVVYSETGDTTPGCSLDTPLYQGPDTRIQHATTGGGSLIAYRVCAVDLYGHVSNGTQAIAVTVSDSPNGDARGTIAINAQDLETTRLAITVSLTATPVITEVCVSETPSCDNWVAMVPELPWVLSPGEGQRDLHAWFRTADEELSPMGRD
ncbi:MAG: hypothetical protein ACI9VR_001944, partial [Cognaticolwellia sp.]